MSKYARLTEVDEQGSKSAGDAERNINVHTDKCVICVNH